MPEVDAPEPFSDMQCVAVRVGLPRIEPAAIPQADRVDDKRVALPSTDRVTKPRRLGILRQRTSVGEHLAEHEADLRFVQQYGLGRRLDDLELIDRINSRNAGRHAEAERVVDVIAPLALRLDAGRPRRHLHVGWCQVLREIEEETIRSPSLPDARQVRLAVGQAWRSRIQVRLAIRQPRNAGRRIGEPLRVEGGGTDQQRRDDRQRAPSHDPPGPIAEDYKITRQMTRLH